MTDPTVAVLDIDGTLIDSNYQHALAWYRALRSVGETCPVWRLHRLIGMGGDQVVMAVGGEDLERRVGDQAREQQGKEVDALLGEMAPLPVGIADDWTSSADVEASKPAPDLLQVALKKLGAPPGVSSVMVGDSVWDVEAAKRAGMPAYDTPGDLAKALGDTPLA